MDIDLSIQTYITCIIHDLGTLGILQKIQVMSFLQDDKFSPSIHGFGLSSINFSALPPNWKDDLS